MGEDYTVTVNPRARNVRLKISLYDASLVVIIPPRFDRREIPAIIQEKHSWIERTQRRVLEQRKQHGCETPGAKPNQINLLAIGEEWAVEYVSSSWLLKSDPENKRLLIAEQVKELGGWQRALQWWTGQKAKIHLVPWLDRLSREHQLPFERVMVKGQRTRWSSCSGKKTISINYKLLFLPPALVSYVFLHELCHTVHMNHSPEFWSLVRAREQDYKHLDREINSAWRYVPDWMDRSNWEN